MHAAAKDATFHATTLETRSAIKRNVERFSPHSHAHHMDQFQIGYSGYKETRRSVPSHFTHQKRKSSKHTCCWSASCLWESCTSTSPPDGKRNGGSRGSNVFQIGICEGQGMRCFAKSVTSAHWHWRTGKRHVFVFRPLLLTQLEVSLRRELAPIIRSEARNPRSVAPDVRSKASSHTRLQSLTR